MQNRNNKTNKKSSLSAEIGAETNAKEKSEQFITKDNFVRERVLFTLLMFVTVAAHIYMIWVILWSGLI